MEIDEIKEKVEEEIKIDRNDLLEENVQQISLHHRYLSLLEEQKRKLRKLEAVKDKWYAKLYDDYRWNSEKRRKTKAELESAVKKHPKYAKINKMMETQRNLVEYLEGVVDLLKNRYFILKNLVEMDKMENMGA